MKKFKDTCSTCKNIKLGIFNSPYNCCKIDNRPIHNGLLRLYLCKEYKEKK